MIKDFYYNSNQEISFTEKDNGRLESTDIRIPIFDANCHFIIDAKKFEESDKAEMIEAIDNLLKLDSPNKVEIESLIIDKYREAKNVYFDENESKENIWQKIVLRFIYIEKRKKDNKIYTKVQFDCSWDEEGGLQLVFNNAGKLVRVSPIDGWLTDADAYGRD